MHLGILAKINSAALFYEFGGYWYSLWWYFSGFTGAELVMCFDYMWTFIWEVPMWDMRDSKEVELLEEG